MNRFLIALLPAFVLVTAKQPTYALLTLIVLGQGHFLLTYLYQWRAGKVTKRYLLSFAIIAPLLFWFAYAGSFSYLLVATAILFAMHFYYDEARILETEDTHLSFSLLTPPMLFFVAFLLEDQFSIDLFGPALIASAAIFATSFFRFGTAGLLTKHAAILNLYGLGIVLAYLLDLPLSSEELLGAIIIHHYTTWYIHQYIKLRPLPEYFTRYIHDTLVVNVVVILGFVLFYTTPDFLFLEYVYAANFFYAWTILHILFCSQDFQHAMAVRIKSLKRTFS